MTTIHVDVGICGFFATIHSAKEGKSGVEITLESDCAMVKALGKSLKHLTMKDIFHQPFNRNRVYEEAAQSNLHGSCPVPCAIMKAVEVELQLALKKDVSFSFT